MTGNEMALMANIAVDMQDKKVNEVLDKIKAEIESKYESIPDTFHHYETGFTDALEWVLSIIDKYKAESEEKEK